MFPLNEPIVIDKQFKANAFFDTTARVKISGPTGVISFLDFVALEKTMDSNPFDSQKVEPGFLAPTQVMGLKVFTKFIETDTYQVASSFPDYGVVNDLEKYHGTSPKDMLIPILFNEIETGAAKQLSKIYREAGELSAYNRLTKWQLFLQSKFKSLEFPTYVEQPEKISLKLRLFSNMIAAKSRRGAANFCITNVQTAAYLQDDPTFVFNPLSGSVVLTNSSIPYLIGQINGMNVFVDPHMNFNDCTIILGRNTKEGEPGVYCMEYQKQFVENADGPTMELRYQMRSRHLIAPVGNMVEDSYYAFKVEWKKKPLWRKLFKL